MTLPEISLHPATGAVIFSVRVQPRASKNEVAGVWGGALKIRLQAPATENRANEALIDFFSDILKTPKAAVRIQSGEHARTKRLEILGVTKQQILDLLNHEA